MTNQEREAAIKEVLAEIQQIRPRWEYLTVIIQTNTFNEGDNQADFHRECNGLDNKLHELNIKLRELQVKYYVDYFNDNGILTTIQMMLNSEVRINTHKNGWDVYMNNPESRELIKTIYGFLSQQNNRPQLQHIVNA